MFIYTKMVECDKCKKEFRNNYDLTRHTLRKTTCEISIVENNRCNCCNKQYSTQKTLKNHKCKMDPITILEQQLDIKSKIVPVSPLECRFCNKIFSRKDVLGKHSCKERKNYIEELKTNVVNVFGNENGVSLDTILDLFREANKTETDCLLKAGKLIILYSKCLRENTNNQNIIILNSRSITGKIKTENGWETETTDELIDRAFKNTAKNLYGKKDDINNHNVRVFQSTNNKNVFNEISNFSTFGITNGRTVTERRRLRAGFKVGLIKKR